MARFRGTVRGGRGEASRLGNNTLVTHADGWKGGVSVTLYDKDGVDHARISLTFGSAGTGPVATIYDGPIDAETRWKLNKERLDRAEAKAIDFLNERANNPVNFDR